MEKRHNWPAGTLVRCIKPETIYGGRLTVGKIYTVAPETVKDQSEIWYWVGIIQDNGKGNEWNPHYFEIVVLPLCAEADISEEEIDKAMEIING